MCGCRPSQWVMHCITGITGITQAMAPLVICNATCCCPWILTSLPPCLPPAVRSWEVQEPAPRLVLCYACMAHAFTPLKADGINHNLAHASQHEPSSTLYWSCCAQDQGSLVHPDLRVFFKRVLGRGHTGKHEVAGLGIGNERVTDLDCLNGSNSSQKQLWQAARQASICQIQQQQQQLAH